MTAQVPYALKMAKLTFAVEVIPDPPVASGEGSINLRWSDYVGQVTLVIRKSLLAGVVSSDEITRWSEEHEKIFFILI